MEKEKIHIALVGNPNCGKTSLFNCLTGMHQKVSNFPGVTVDKIVGETDLETCRAQIIDLPGTYSLYPRRLDEWVSYKVILEQDKDMVPDVVVVVADASNLKRNLLFCSQLIDIKVPLIIALTMMDQAAKKGTKIDIEALQQELDVPVIAVNPRKKKGIPQLKKAIETMQAGGLIKPLGQFIPVKELAPQAIEAVQYVYPSLSDYAALHYLINYKQLELEPQSINEVEKIIVATGFNSTRVQASEIMQRYARIKQVLQVSVKEPDVMGKKLLTEKLDTVLLHRKWGYIILLAVLFLLFQSVFFVANYPMDWIDSGISHISQWLFSTLPNNAWTDLLINGIIAGMGGVLLFIPQIAILFGLITILEDTGYMARISFLTDRLMRSVGLNGKSVMPMISGFACAIPAIMSTRNIENRKERLLTILITPLMSCSARLPVFIILTGLVIPKTYLFGFIGIQGLVMLGLYLSGFIMALIVSFIAKHLIKIKEKSFFILELPVYKAPRWNNVLHTMWQKAHIFVFDAGKIIMIISLVLWVLSTWGPGKKREQLNEAYQQALASPGADTASLTAHYNTGKLENSYIGILGKKIEPVIAPLGYDWKIGIAIITSFAAREVFVGTMATLYSVGNDDKDATTLKSKMKNARRQDGTPVYTFAAGISLMLFYVFAMQCMSTLSIVQRETRSWKWPLIQLAYMTGFAYIISLIVYQLLK